MDKVTRPIGIYSPTVTGFNADESLNEKATRAYIRFLLASHVHGLAPMGSAGEFIALTEKERMQVMEWTLNEVNGKVPVYAGTGHYSTRVTIELSRHAMSCGAQGLMIMPPYLLRPPKDDILKHFRKIREAIPLPIMVYNVPILAGVELSPRDIQLLADEDVLHAVKWSHPEVARIHDTKFLCGDKVSVFVGVDLVGFEGLAVGADGYIGGMAMMMPSRLRKVFDTIRSEGGLAEARRQWNQLLPLIQFEYRALFSDIGQPHWLAVCREAADLQGIQVGPPRSPLQSLSLELRKELKKLLDDLKRLDDIPESLNSADHSQSS